MKNRLFLSLSVFAFLSACNPFYHAKSTTINGQVRTYGTEEVIKHPPVKVQLIEESSGGVLVGGAPTYKLLEETWTEEENGYFSLSHDLYEDVNYFLAVNSETVKSGFNYYKPDEYADKALPYNKLNNVGGTVTKNCYLKARGWVKFEIERPNPVPNSSYYIDLSGAVLINFPPSNVADVISPKVGGYTHKYYYYFQGADSSFSNFNIVYVIPFDTVSEKVVF